MGNAAVEQRTPCPPSAPLRENKEFETDAPPGHCSTAALERDNMQNPCYKRVVKLRTNVQNLFKEVVTLLSEKDIKLRQDDGDLVQINISIPKSVNDSFVIGLRYLKKDETPTEDHFLIKKEIEPDEKEIQVFYKGKLEREFLEYKGTHKQQIDISQIKSSNNVAYHTSINTISLNNSWGRSGENEDI